MGGRRPQAPRQRRARRLRARTEDRRLRDQPRLRGRALRPRRDARRRITGRGRDAEPAYDRCDSPANDAFRRRDGAVGARGARRGLHAARRLPRRERAPRRGGEADVAEPAQRRGGVVAPEGLVGDRPPPAVDLGLRHGAPGRARARLAMGDAAVAACAGVPHESVRRARRVGRRGRRALPGVGAPANGARLRDRRHRDQGRLLRAAGAARRAARSPALGARIQVGADDRGDPAERDPHSRRPHRQPQPVGGARACRGRRRHDLACDAAQRGGHQPEGDPRGRRRDRPARRRRHPAGRRARRRAPQRDEAVRDAGGVPALRRRDRQARGRGDAPLPEPRLPVARARDAEQLGDGCRGHRRRRRADGLAALAARRSCAPSRSSTASRPSS